jgi:hypothetical protein
MQNPKQRIAGTCERIDDHPAIRWQASGDGRDIETNTVGKSIARTLDNGSAKQPDSEAVPFSGRHSIDMNVIGVAEIVDSVPLNFRKRQYFIALGAIEQQLPPILR